jgi:hypothetical protein
MLRLHVSTEGNDHMAAGPPEPVLDFDSKQPRVGGDGRPLYSVSVVALGPEGAEVLKVKVPGEPKGIVRGTPVTLTGVVATYWELNGRSGISFSAERIDPVTTKAS